jgi:aminopeptidase N
MWHESAHEWWGNNRESILGRAAALKILAGDQPENREPIIGVYNVNDFHTGDMYSKGALLLETLRNVIHNDSLWFAVFRGIQRRFRYTPVRTEDIVGYFNSATGTDYTWFFDQYLRHPAIPVLVLAFRQDGDRLHVDYRWQADVPGFRMPVKVTLAKGGMGFIHPTTTSQTLELKGMTQKDFVVDTADFYIGVRTVRAEP